MAVQRQAAAIAGEVGQLGVVGLSGTGQDAPGHGQRATMLALLPMPAADVQQDSGVGAAVVDAGQQPLGPGQLLHDGAVLAQHEQRGPR